MILTRDGQDNEAGYYVDASYDGTNRKIVTPGMVLNKGVYAVSIDYTASNPDVQDDPSDGDYGVCTEVIADNGEHYSLEAGLIRLATGTNRYTYKVYVNENGIKVHVQNGIEDNANAYIMVNDVNVQYLNHQSALYYGLKMIFWFLFVDVIMFLYLMKRRTTGEWLQKHGMTALILGAILFIVEIPMMLNYIPYGDDILFHTYRLEELAEGLRSGMFPVKIQPGWFNGYAYATSVFYGDLLLYIPALIRMVGFPLRFAYKFYVLMINCITVAGSYYCFRRISNRKYVGLMGSALYSLAIYRLDDLYNRAAVGEYTAMAFLPLIVLGFWMIYSSENERHRYGWIYLTIGISGVVEAHVLSVLMVMLFCVLFCLLMWKRTFTRKTLFQLIKGAVSTLLLNMCFIVPFLDYYKNVDIVAKHATYDFQGRSEYIPSLFATMYSMTRAKYGAMGYMPMSVGFVFAIVIVVSLYYLIYHQKMNKIYGVGIVLFLGVLALFMCTDVFPYRWLQLHISPVYNLIQNMQFPWRFLGIATILLTLSFVLLEKIIEKENSYKIAIIIGMVICAVSCWQTVNYMSQLTNDIVHIYPMIASNAPFPQHGGEYILNGTDLDSLYDNSTTTSDDNTVKVTLDNRNGLTFFSTVSNSSETEQYIDYPIQNYKGYYAIGNGGKMNTVMGDNNKIRVLIPAGYRGSVVVDFAEPWYWRMAECVSFIFCIAFCVWGTVKYKKKKVNC